MNAGRGEVNIILDPTLVIFKFLGIGEQGVNIQHLEWRFGLHGEI